MEKICVAVRVRPPVAQETSSSTYWRVEDNRISLHKTLGTPISGVSHAFGIRFSLYFCAFISFLLKIAFSILFNAVVQTMCSTKVAPMLGFTSFLLRISSMPLWRVLTVCFSFSFPPFFFPDSCLCSAWFLRNFLTAEELRYWVSPFHLLSKKTEPPCSMRLVDLRFSSNRFDSFIWTCQIKISDQLDVDVEVDLCGIFRNCICLWTDQQWQDLHHEWLWIWSRNHSSGCQRCI